MKLSVTEVFAYFSVVHVIWFSVGGGFGAALRYVIGQLIHTEPGEWPLATLVVNISGAAVLGFIAAYFNDSAYSLGFLFWELGVLGGYTTLSTFSVETLQLIRRYRYRAALSYTIASFVGSVGVLILGFKLGGLVS